MDYLSHKASHDELLLLASNDDSAYERILARVPRVMKLQRKHDNLEDEVVAMAQCNMARESDFVRDRAKLRQIIAEVAKLKKRITHEHIVPALERFEKSHHRVASEARRCEVESENLARRFLQGELNHQNFVDQYVNLRKVTSKKRILADRLAKDKDRFSFEMGLSDEKHDDFCSSS